jgi:hypothetical protein
MEAPNAASVVSLMLTTEALIARRASEGGGAGGREVRTGWP